MPNLTGRASARLPETREAAIAALFNAEKIVAKGNDHDTRKALTAFFMADHDYRTAAGLDPEDGPTNLEEAREHYLGAPAGSGPLGSANMVFPSAPQPGGASWGAQFVDARRQRFGAQLLETGSTAVAVPIVPEPIADPRQARFIYELVPQEDAPGGAYKYMHQTLRDLNAAVVARGERKPVSEFTLKAETGETDVIAHLSDPVYRFDLRDARMLQSFIDAEMRLGVNLALDALTVSTLSTTATAGAGTVNLAGIRAAITALQKLNLEPDAIAMSPETWEAVEDEALTTYAGGVNSSSLITDALARRLYGVGVAVSTSIADDLALVGDFRGSSMLFVTGDVELTVSDSIYLPDAGDGNPGTTFEQNTVVFRAERRATPVATRPAGFILVGASS